MTDLTETTLAAERKYTGRIISVDLLDIEMPDGRRAKREALSETPHAQDQDPDENVHPVVLTEAEVEDAIRSGAIFDSKTLSAWLCWKLTR